MARASEPKTRPTGASVAEFLTGAGNESRQADCATLVAVMSQATGAPACMWGPSIVGFGRYAYEYDSGHSGEWPVVGFSPRKAEIVLYIMPGFSEQTDLLDRLGRHRIGKSCLYIKRLADVDMAVLNALIERSVTALQARRTDVKVATTPKRRPK